LLNAIKPYPRYGAEYGCVTAACSRAVVRAYSRQAVPYLQPEHSALTPVRKSTDWATSVSASRRHSAMKADRSYE
jgi:hypothetical protein